MPIYDYKCDECNCSLKEQLRKVSERFMHCPNCNKELSPLLNGSYKIAGDGLTGLYHGKESSGRKLF